MPGSPHRALPAHRALVALLALSLLLNLIPIWWGLPNYQGWAYDEVVPENLVGDGAWPKKYPPMHRHVLRLALLPMTGLEALGVAPAADLERYHLAYLIIRLVSVLMATATVYLVYRCGRTLASRWASVAAAAMVALMPPFVYYAKTANLEAPYLFWFALSLYFFLRALQRRRGRDFALFAAAAALSICSKDQAYGLYLLTPIPLVAVLWRERGGRALIDRRVWLAAAALAAVVVLAYELYRGPDEIRRHVEAATAPSTFNVDTATPEGQLERLALAIRQVAFSLSLPLALLAAAGAVAAFRRRRLETLALASMIVGYYLGFILLLPYQTVRYLLPVAMISSLFAACAIDAWAPLARRRRVWAVALGALFGFALLRAAWVDRSMLRDSRYRVERWLAEVAPEQPAVGFGRQHMMPRGVVATSFLRLYQDGCDYLDERRPAHLVINLADVRDERERAVLSELSDGAFNYREALRYRSAVWPRPWGVDRLLSNLDKINPEILVFEREDERCLDARSLPRALDELAGGGSKRLRRQLTAFLSERGAGLGVRLAGGAEALGFGFHYGGWTRGTQAAAVLVTNELEGWAVPTIRLACLAPPEHFPLTVSIDDGREPQSFTFDRRGRIEARVRALGPGTSRLLFISSDRSWRRPPDDRQLGVRLDEVRLRERRPRRSSGASAAAPGSEDGRYTDRVERGGPGS